MRFGPVPEDVRGRIESIDSIERLVELAAESAVASSLSALGLT